MKILFLNAYFQPEIISFTHLEQNLIERFVKEGHDISVVCPVPTRGVTKDIIKKYSTIKQESLYDGKVKVQRFWAPQEKSNIITRAFRYVWCNIRQYQLGRKYKDADIIFSVSTPPTQGLFAGLLSKKLKCPFVYGLQDIFPESLEMTGISSKKSFVYKLGDAMAKYIYKNADSIIVISKAFKETLLAKGVEENKIHIVPNWVDENHVIPVERENNSLFDELNLSRECFYVTYAGNLGKAQNTDIILEAARKTINNTDIKYVVFGAGSCYDYFQTCIKNENLTNVSLFPIQPYERVSQVYSLGNVSLVTCKKGAGGIAMPSKTWSIMSSGTAVAASFDGGSDMQEIIENSESGVFSEADDADCLVRNIEYLFTNPDICTQYGINARQYILNNLTRDIGTQKYLDVFNSLVN